MNLARKIVLHSPISDEGLLEDFVKRCLEDEVSIVAVVGPGCERIHDLLDEIIVGDGSDQERDFTTTWHEYDSLEDVINMLRHWEVQCGGSIQEVRL